MAFVVLAYLSECCAEQISVGQQKQLFADHFISESLTNVTRKVGQATKHSVVLEPTLPTDFQTGKMHDGPDGGAGYEFGESCFWLVFLAVLGREQTNVSPVVYVQQTPRQWRRVCRIQERPKLDKPLVAKDGKSNLIN